MIFLLSAVPLVAIARALERRFHRPYADAFPVTVFGAVLLMYLFALAGVLKLSVFVIYALGAGALGYCLYDRLIAKHRAGLSPAFVLVLAAIPCSVLFAQGRLLTIWDEFSHWGTVVKNMACLDALGTAPGSTVLYRSYPPALSLLQYYFVRFEPTFLESSLFSAKDVMTFAALLPFLRRAEWKRWPQALLLMATALLLPFVEYFYYYRTIIVDGLLGLLFGCVLISWLSAQKHDWFDILRVCLPMAVLALIKPSGAGLAAIALLILAAEFLILGRKRIPGPALKRWLWLLLPAAALIVSKVSWDLHMAVTNTQDFWNASSRVSLSSLLGLGNGMAQYQKEVFVAFFDELFSLSSDPHYLVSLSPALWLTFLIVPGTLTLALQPEKPRAQRTLLITGCLIAGAALWLLSMLVMYLFIMVPAEAPGLASFNRYFSTYQLGAFMTALWLMIDAWEAYRPRRTAVYLGLLLCALSALVSYKDVLYATVASPVWNGDTREDRQAYAHGAQLSAMLDPARDKVAVISQESEENGGMDYYVTRFQAVPVDVTVTGSWSIGKPYHAKDIWSADLEPEEWAASLAQAGITHLYLYHIDQTFLTRYGSLFSEPPKLEGDALYLVSYPGGALTFTLVPWA